MESQVVADERVASILQRSEDEKSKGFERDHKLAQHLEVVVFLDLYYQAYVQD